MKQYSFLDGSTIAVSDDTCRGCYLERASILPDEIAPVWENTDFVIRQDAECPVPGFYIVSTRDHIHSIGDLSPEKASALGIIVSRLRDCMRRAIGINRLHIILEERLVEPHVHIWLLPLWSEIMAKYHIDPKVWNSNILEYLKLFDYSENREKILSYNAIIKEALKNDPVLHSLGA